jgi:hypothetical protein
MQCNQYVAALVKAEVFKPRRFISRYDASKDAAKQ